jgi:hypothetical protein
MMQRSLERFRGSLIERLSPSLIGRASDRSISSKFIQVAKEYTHKKRIVDTRFFDPNLLHQPHKKIAEVKAMIHTCQNNTKT